MLCVSLIYKQCFKQDLDIEAFDQLRSLEQYLLEEKHGKRMAELYELVQYAGNILPRLYVCLFFGKFTLLFKIQQF